MRFDVARDLGAANPGGASEVRPVGLVQARNGAEDERPDAAWIETRADLGAAPGGRRAAALLPRSRHGRGGVPGRLPARAEELAAQRSAARSRGLADHGRPQRRHRRGASALASSRRCPRTTRPSPTSTDAEGALAERLDGSHYRDDMLRLLFICCHPRPAGDAADRAGAAHRLGPVGQADRARLPGRRKPRWSSASRAPRRRIADADVPFEAPGAVERAERLAARRRDGLSGLQRGLFGQRRATRRARAPLCRGGDPAGAAAAAAVPERAGDHGAPRAAAAAARAQRRALCPERRARSCSRTRTARCGTAR